MTKENLSVIFGNAIMKRRQRKRLTQVDFAKLLIIEQYSLSRTGKRLISPKMSCIQQIVNIFDCSIADLFRQMDSPTFVKSREICYILEDLPQEMQYIILGLVENTMYYLKNFIK